MVDTPSSIHPTAIISEQATIADGVTIGPYTVIDGPVTIDSGCVIGPFVHLIGPMTLGKNNQVHAHAVLGDKPQHLQYKDEETRVEIGEGNTFREHVTVHRGTTHSHVTIIGNNNYFMANSHIGHDCIVENNCTLANGALVGGHCHLHDNVILAGNVIVHQFVTLGRLSMMCGMSGTSKDIPPFLMQQGPNTICGVNIIGMRRAGFKKTDIDAVRSACHILYREGNLLSTALEKMNSALGQQEVIQEMLQFIHESKRGIFLGWLDHRADAA